MRKIVYFLALAASIAGLTAGLAGARPVVTAADACPLGTTQFDYCQTAPSNSHGVTQIGTSGDNEQTGSEGPDIQRGGPGNDTQHGRNGSDEQDGGPGNDTQFGGSGNDTQIGGSGNDLQNGDSGNDTQRGGTGLDVMTGGSGNDKMDGGPDNDAMSGGSGGDTIVGGTGSDTINGDGTNGAASRASAFRSAGATVSKSKPRAGNDVIYAQDGQKDRINCGGGRDKVYADKKDRLVNCERVIYKKTKAPKV